MCVCVCVCVFVCTYIHRYIQTHSRTHTHIHTHTHTHTHTHQAIAFSSSCMPALQRFEALLQDGSITSLKVEDFMAKCLARSGSGRVEVDTLRKILAMTEELERKHPFIFIGPG